MVELSFNKCHLETGVQSASVLWPDVEPGRLHCSTLCNFIFVVGIELMYGRVPPIDYLSKIVSV